MLTTRDEPMGNNPYQDMNNLVSNQSLTSNSCSSSNLIRPAAVDLSSQSDDQALVEVVPSANDEFTSEGGSSSLLLREKEQFLESSHRALKEKLAKVRYEIQQLSEMHSVSSADFEGQSSAQQYVSNALIHDEESGAKCPTENACKLEFEAEI